MKDGRGWRGESLRHSLAARGIRTTWDELEDGDFSPSYRSVATMMRQKRISGMEGELDDYQAAIRARRNRLNANRHQGFRSVLTTYQENDGIPDQQMLPAHGIWSKIKSGAKKVGSAIKKAGSAVKKGAKKVGGAAKKVYGKAKDVGGKLKEWGGKAGEAIKSGASWLGEKGSAAASWIKSKFSGPDKEMKKQRRTYDVMGNNITTQMDLDDLRMETQRLDQSNRALERQWAVRQNVVDKRYDLYKSKQQYNSMEKEKKRLKEDMFR